MRNDSITFEKIQPPLLAGDGREEVLADNALWLSSNDKLQEQRGAHVTLRYVTISYDI